MQFKHPEILFALFLLIIPIIVHLFQLRRFKKVPFTNVKLLKQVEQNTRKSSKLKKFLILCTRLLALTGLIFAFAQPFTSLQKSSKPTDTYIYLDNSFSMQAKGNKGELLKRAAQDIIESYQTSKNIHLITNNKFLKNLSHEDLKKELLELDYHPINEDLNTIIFKIKNNFKNKSNTINNIFLISDFQYLKEINNDSINNYNIVQLNPIKKSNISIDSVYIGGQSNENITLKAVLKAYNSEIENKTLSLYNGTILLGKSSVSLDKEERKIIDFIIPNKEVSNGRLMINDVDLVFDNQLYFSINKEDKINVLAIGNDNYFLRKIYTDDEFNYTDYQINQLDYSQLNNQNLVILNELENIPNALINSLNDYLDKEGNMVIIPSSTTDISNYKPLFLNLGLGSFPDKTVDELAITNINFTHPVLKNVFEKEIQNFQYPTVKSYYKFNFNNNSILSFENGTPFISQRNIKNGTVSLLYAAINNNNANFKSSPLIVPVFYNFGKLSYKHSEISYTIGNENEIEVKATLEKDNILHVVNDEASFIPLQQIGNRSVKVNLNEQPVKSGVYQLKNKEETLKNLAFNYNRKESDLTYTDVKSVIGLSDNVNYFTNVKEAFKTVNDQYKTNNIWHLFLILSVLFLLLEMLLLKFFKT